MPNSYQTPVICSRCTRVVSCPRFGGLLQRLSAMLFVVAPHCFKPPFAVRCMCLPAENGQRALHLLQRLPVRGVRRPGVQNGARGQAPPALCAAADGERRPRSHHKLRQPAGDLRRPPGHRAGVPGPHRRKEGKNCLSCYLFSRLCFYLYFLNLHVLSMQRYKYPDCRLRERMLHSGSRAAFPPERVSTCVTCT